MASTLDPALIEAILAGNMDTAEEAQISRQFDQADQLRAGALSSPRGVNAGRVYVAPSWGSVLERGMQGYMSGKAAEEGIGKASAPGAPGTGTGLKGLGERKAARAKQWMAAKQAGPSGVTMTKPDDKLEL